MPFIYDMIKPFSKRARVDLQNPCQDSEHASSLHYTSPVTAMSWQLSLRKEAAHLVYS